jgi:hypothetical protein
VLTIADGFVVPVTAAGFGAQTAIFPSDPLFVNEVSEFCAVPPIAVTSPSPSDGAAERITMLPPELAPRGGS